MAVPIVIRFTCKRCGLIDTPIEVRQRKLNEPVDYWIDRVVGRALHGWHDLKSPDCDETDWNVTIPADVDTPPWQTIMALGC